MCPEEIEVSYLKITVWSTIVIVKSFFGQFSLTPKYRGTLESRKCLQFNIGVSILHVVNSVADGF